MVVFKMIKLQCIVILVVMFHYSGKFLLHKKERVRISGQCARGIGTSKQVKKFF